MARQSSVCPELCPLTVGASTPDRMMTLSACKASLFALGQSIPVALIAGPLLDPDVVDDYFQRYGLARDALTRLLPDVFGHLRERSYYVQPSTLHDGRGHVDSAELMALSNDIHYCWSVLNGLTSEAHASAGQAREGVFLPGQVFDAHQEIVRLIAGALRAARIPGRGRGPGRSGSRASRRRRGRRTRRSSICSAASRSGGRRRPRSSRSRGSSRRSRGSSRSRARRSGRGSTRTSAPSRSSSRRTICVRSRAPPRRSRSKGRGTRNVSSGWSAAEHKGGAPSHGDRTKRFAAFRQGPGREPPASLAQSRKPTPRSSAKSTSSGVISVSPWEARPSRATALPKAAPGQARNDESFTVSRITSPAERGLERPPPIARRSGGSTVGTRSRGGMGRWVGSWTAPPHGIPGGFLPLRLEHGTLWCWSRRTT